MADGQGELTVDKQLTRVEGKKKKHPNLIIIMIIIIITTVLSRAWVLSRFRCYKTKISFVAVKRKRWKQSRAGREGVGEARQDLGL